MKKRTKSLANIIMIFVCLGFVGFLLQIGSGRQDISLGGLAGSAITLVSAYIMKKGSKVGWWVLTVIFGLTAVVFLVGVIAALARGKWAALTAFGVLGFLFWLPFIILATDPPWKWSGTAAASGGQTMESKDQQASRRPKKRTMIWIGLTCVAVFCIAGVMFKAHRYRVQRKSVEFWKQRVKERDEFIIDYLDELRRADVEGRSRDITDLERKINTEITKRNVEGTMLMETQGWARESACWAIVCGSIGFPIAMLLCFLFLKSLNPLEKGRFPAAVWLWNFFVVFHMTLLLLVLVVVGTLSELIPPYVSDEALYISIIVLFSLCALCLPVLLLYSRRYAVEKAQAAPWGWFIFLPVAGITILKRLRHKA